MEMHVLVAARFLYAHNQSVLTQCVCISYNVLFIHYFLSIKGVVYVVVENLCLRIFH